MVVAVPTFASKVEFIDAVIVLLAPTQIVEGVAVIELNAGGNGLTVIVACAVVAHPAKEPAELSVAVTVYVVVELGLTLMLFPAPAPLFQTKV